MTQCSIECTSIPDGFDPADMSRLRLSVLLRPLERNLSTLQAGPAIDLEKWPTQVPRLKFQIWAGTSKAHLEPIETISADKAFEGTLTPKISPKAQEWWDALWANPSDLLAYLSLLNGGGSSITTGPKATVNGYDYAHLHQAAIDYSLHEFARASYAFEARRRGKNLGTEFSGLTQRAARDPNDPLVRIARCLHLSDTNLASIASSSSGIALPIGAGSAAAAGTGDALMRGSEFVQALNPQASELVFRPDSGIGANKVTPTVEAEKYKEFDRAMMTDEELNAESDALDPRFDHAHQVIGALQAHPALRKFARQIADLAIDPAKLRSALGSEDEDLKGILAVEALALGDSARAAPSPNAVFTAFILRTGKDALFEPCPTADFDSTIALGSAASPNLRDGFVLPNEIGSTRRFRIASIDGIAAYYARKRSNESMRDAYFGGARIADVPTEPTGFRTRGLMLLDTLAKETAEAAEERQTIIAGDRLLFAEDLTDGYRVDVVAPNGAVFPACARSVDYDAFNGLSADLRQAYISQRNDGYVSPLARTWAVRSVDSMNPGERFLSVSQVMFTWTGRPLGLQAGEQEESQQAQGESLFLGVRYGFDRERPGPILRQFGHYRFVLRARKLNGSSVPLSTSRAGEFALGSQDDKLGSGFRAAGQPDPGYEFGLVEKAPAPTLLVDHTFKASHGIDPSDRETVSSILVTTGSGETKVRWLTSPITGFDLAEVQGQLDPRSSSAEERLRAERLAKYGAYRYLFHNSNGSFPTIKDGTVAIALAMRPIAPPSSIPDVPHFVDATLRTVAARLVADKATPTQGLASTILKTDPAFFPAGSTPHGFEPDDVVPIRLEVRAVGIGNPSTIRNGPDFRLKIPGPSGRTLTVPTIYVDVAPADTLKLELWCNKTMEAFHANPTVAAALGPAKMNKLAVEALLDPGSSASRKLYGEFVRNHRTASLSDVTTLRIEHPVVKPLLQPKQVTPIRIYRSIDKKTWEETIKIGNGADQPDAGKTFAAGRIAVDRKSTGEVWAEAFWVEVASKDRVFRTSKPEDPARVEQTGLFRRETPTQFRRLFSLPPLELPLKGEAEDAAAYLRRINEVDLLLDDAVLPSAGGSPSVRIPRSLSADFDCDQHRTLAVRLVARSRFAPPDDVPAAPVDAVNVPTQTLEDETYLKRSASREACLTAVETGAWPPDVYKIVLPATRRPPPPHLLRDKGTLYQRELRTSTDGSENSLVHIYRCWLDGDWFASGEGEKLAIVCRQPRAAPLPDWANAQASRWGGDGTSEPGQKLRVATDLPESDSTYLLARQIGASIEDEAVLWRDPNDGTATAKVALACLEPRFHDGYGRWYCDIELKPTGAYKAALKLVLARYQKNALSGRQLSSTVPIDVVMLHQPWRFAVKRSGSTVGVTITGPAYQGRAPMLDKMAGVTQGSTAQMLSELIGETSAIAMEMLPQSPLIVAELERLDSRGAGPLPLLSGGHAVVATSLGVQAQNVRESVEGFSDPLMMKRWTLSLNIPEEDVGKSLAVRVSLASAHANSHARNRSYSGGVGRDGAGFQPSALDGALIFLPEPIVVQLRLPDE